MIKLRNCSNSNGKTIGRFNIKRKKTGNDCREALLKKDMLRFCIS